ncbi:DNA translocase FtsK [bacterium]|nr:DNA translocase FtsK [bacterium]
MARRKVTSRTRNLPKGTSRASVRAQRDKTRLTLGQLFRERAFKEALSVLMLAVAIVSFVSLYGGDSDANPVGIAGRWIAIVLILAFGAVPSYPLLVVLFIFAFCTLIRRKVHLLILKILASFASAILLGTMFVLIRGQAWMGSDYFFARRLADWLIEYFGAFSVLVAGALLMASGILVAGVGIGQALGFLLRVFGKMRVQESFESASTPFEAVAKSSRARERVTKPKRSSAKRSKPKADYGSDYNADDYQPPSQDLLDEPEPMRKPEERGQLMKAAEFIVQKLGDHNIEGKVVSILPGPIITRHEFQPARGVKISKIISLSDDLALAMRAKFIPRIAPIAGKAVVGIEVANQSRKLIGFKEVLSSKAFAENPSKLKIALGTNIAGEPYIISLNEITHLLIAGATGSGKSVCINCILASLLYSTTPDELELILIDPKVLELSPYNGVPHLKEPVISDVTNAELAFKWAVSEMNNRYQLLAERGVRHVDEYNQRVFAERAKSGKRYSDADMPPELKTIPYLVIIVDELADLMLTARQAIEVPIIKLAAKARAAGIHLVLATQRPSVDVVTGLIKTNFPSRLAFRVAQKVDSRTILDQNGAEKLLGAGDMLFLTPGAAGLVRLHGAFISEREVERVVGHLKKQPGPVRESSIFDEVKSEETVDIDGADDPVYKNAVEIVVRSKYASISLLQRKLQIGHSRAARYIDMMEQQGYVGPFKGSKPREVLRDDVDI